MRPARAIQKFLAISLPLSLWAAGLARAEAPPKRALSLLPATTDAATAEKDLELRFHQDYRLEPPDETLLLRLRWREDPDANTCEETRRNVVRVVIWKSGVGPPERLSDLLPALMRQADRQESATEYSGELETLELARNGLICAPTVLSQSQIRDVFFRSALTRVNLAVNGAGDAFKARAAIQELLVLDSRALEQGYAPKVKRFFNETRTAWLENSHPLAVQTGHPPGSLLVDGVPANTLRELYPGRHVFQLVGPSGEIRTRWVDLPPGTREPALLGELGDFKLETSSQARSALETKVISRELDGHQKAVLRSWADEQGLAPLLLVVEGAAPGQAVLLELTPEATLLPASVPTFEPERKVAVRRTHVEAGLGAVGLSLLGVGGGHGAFQYDTNAIGPSGRIDLQWGRLLVGTRFSILSGNLGEAPETPPMLIELWTGYTLPVASRLRLTPGVAFETAMLSSVLLTLPGDSAPSLLYSAPFLGGQLRARIAGEPVKRLPWLTAGLELSSGLLLGRYNTLWIPGVSIEAAIDVGGRF